MSDTRPLPPLSFLALASTLFDLSFSFQNIGSKYFLDNFKNLRNGAKKSDSGEGFIEFIQTGNFNSVFVMGVKLLRFPNFSFLLIISKFSYLLVITSTGQNTALNVSKTGYHLLSCPLAWCDSSFFSCLPCLTH